MIDQLTFLVKTVLALAFASAILAIIRPSLWSVLAAGILNAAAVMILWPFMFS